MNCFEHNIHLFTCLFTITRHTVAKHKGILKNLVISKNLSCTVNFLIALRIFFKKLPSTAMKINQIHYYLFSLPNRNNVQLRF